MVPVMNLTETPASHTAGWSRELLQLLAVCGPLTAISAAALLRAAGHTVTDREVEQELASRLDVHESAEGWVSVPAIAEGAVLTMQLTPQACQTWMIAAGGDLDLWARAWPCLTICRSDPWGRTFWHLAEAAGLKPHEITASASGSALPATGALAEDGMPRSTRPTWRYSCGSATWMAGLSS